MELQSLQIIVLCVCLGSMFGQLFVPNKQVTHILFAIFCGSVAMSLAKNLSGNVIGPYQYLIGMAACITCNGYWLLSRTFFRPQHSISYQHILFAGAIAVLIMLNQGYLFASNSGLVNVADGNLGQHILRELTVLLSSSILVLSFWEGCRGYRSADRTEKLQRLLFLMTFGGAVAISKATQGIYANAPLSQEFATTAIILFVVINTQLLILWRSHTARQQAGNGQPANNVATVNAEEDLNAPNTSNAADETLLSKQVETLINDEALFLQPNLKISDIAQKLGVPEYRISNALRHHLAAKNFNQYINELRIRHAQTLLADTDKQKWTVLVVGLESGFASVGPFTRAFKSITGYTPNQYRQKVCQPKSA
ncbi:MAG: AraC family transcriptional regulator [Colwelliaceae bacterium]|nr:AraC family transcriptional regulator [Colwelliaceae bacterium]